MTHPHYQTVITFFSAAATHATLAGDLRRLEIVSLHWARFATWARERRFREQNQQYWDADAPRAEDMPDLVAPTEAVLAAFVGGTLQLNPPSLTEFIDATPAGIAGARAHRGHVLRGRLDLPSLVAAHHHLLTLDGDLGDDERTCRLRMAAEWADLLGARLVPDRDGRDVDGTPPPEERTLIALLAHMAAVAPLDDARPIWQPVLAAGIPASYWVASFLREVWSAGLAPAIPPASFPALIAEMIAFAEQSDTPKLRGHSTDITLSLVCLDRFGHPRVNERHRDLLAVIRPQWTAWVYPRMRNPYFARALTGFLGEPGGQDLVTDGLLWLAEREQDGETWTDDDLDDAMAELLVKLVARDSELLRHREPPGPAARTVLAALTSRQNPIALQLSAQLS